MNNLDRKNILWKAHDKGLHDGFINFWMGMIEDVIDKVTPDTTLIEFGSINSNFLRFIHLAFPYRKATGVLLDVDKIESEIEWPVPSDTQVSFINESSISSSLPRHDIGFSQEIFSLLPDLEEHAHIMWKLLETDGVYYASFGWHSDNPSSSLQKKLRASKDQPYYSYSLDEVAETFHRVGFEVGFKRLRLPYYMIYEPQMVSSRYGNVNQIISCLQDHKVLFSFRKWETSDECRK